MREIVLDTETTGLDPNLGHRLVEIAAVELNHHVPTGETFHVYLDPQRDIPEDAFRVHGLSAEFLIGKPQFLTIAKDLLLFLSDSPLIIHNAEFDLKFLNSELRRAGLPVLKLEQAVDTLSMARRKHPGSPASLDALCARYRIDSSRRVKHSALIDAEILAEVYLELIGGRQSVLMLAEESLPETQTRAFLAPRNRDKSIRPMISQQEIAAHIGFVETLGSSAIWLRFPAEKPA